MHVAALEVEAGCDAELTLHVRLVEVSLDPAHLLVAERAIPGRSARRNKKSEERQKDAWNWAPQEGHSLVLASVTLLAHVVEVQAALLGWAVQLRPAVQRGGRAGQARVVLWAMTKDNMSHHHRTCGQNYSMYAHLVAVGDETVASVGLLLEALAGRAVGVKHGVLARASVFGHARELDERVGKTVADHQRLEVDVDWREGIFGLRGVNALAARGLLVVVVDAVTDVRGVVATWRELYGWSVC